MFTFIPGIEIKDVYIDIMFTRIISVIRFFFFFLIIFIGIKKTHTLLDIYI